MYLTDMTSSAIFGRHSSKFQNNSHNAGSDGFGPNFSGAAFFLLHQLVGVLLWLGKTNQTDHWPFKRHLLKRQHKCILVSNWYVKWSYYVFKSNSRVTFATDIYVLQFITYFMLGVFVQLCRLSFWNKSNLMRKFVIHMNRYEGWGLIKRVNVFIWFYLGTENWVNTVERKLHSTNCRKTEGRRCQYQRWSENITE